MPRAIWTGAISFGLVTVPVKLYSAVDRKTVRFHQLSGKTGVRVAQKRVDPQTDEDAIKFVQAFVNAGKPIAAICHGPWVLVEADAVKGRTVTSYPSIKTDIRNAGGKWVDEEVVVDQGLVTSRNPDDLPAFNDKMVEEFAEGEHEVREKAGAGASSS